MNELTAALLSDNPRDALLTLYSRGLFDNTPIQTLFEYELSGGDYHNLSLRDHTLAVVATVRPNIVVRLAALLHDVGKPETRTIEDGKVRFLGHEDVGAEIARKFLETIGYDNNVIDSVVLLISQHMKINLYTHEWRDKTVRKLVAKLGKDLDSALDLAYADNEAHSIRHTETLNNLVSRIERSVE